MSHLQLPKPRPSLRASVSLPLTFPAVCSVSLCSHLASKPVLSCMAQVLALAKVFQVLWSRHGPYHTLYRYFVAWHRCYWAADSGNLLMEFMVPTANVGAQQDLLSCAGAIYRGQYNSPCWPCWASFGAAASFNLRWALSLACQGSGWLNCHEQHHIDMQSQGRGRILRLGMSLCFSSFSPASPCTHSVCAFQLLWE